MIENIKYNFIKCAFLKNQDSLKNKIILFYQQKYNFKIYVLIF